VIGQTVSHYKILERVGAGGMGVVYKAEDLKLKRTVALKFLPLDLTQDPEAKERLRLEAQTASALDHPNICVIHEIDETPDGHVFVAMSFYEGETLKQRLARGPLPVAEAIRVASDVARAIAAAHDAGVVHRDIKPANVILTRRGDVKLLDFGIAKLSGRTALTRTGTTFGTVAYMAPEHVRGQVADQQTDVWALGVVLYEMVAGRPPFEGDHEVAIINAISNLAPAPLKQVRPEVPDALDAVVSRALQKPRDARYATAHDMLRDLEELRPTGPGPTAAQTSAVPASRSRRAMVAAAVVAALVVAGLGGWWAAKASRVSAARQQIQQARKLVQEENFSAAFRLMRSLESQLAGDPEFEAARTELMLPANVLTTPPGADLFIKGYDEPDADWLEIGRSPLSYRGPLGFFRWRIVKPGFTTFEGAGEAALFDQQFTLAPEGTVPDGMVFVPDGAVPTPGGPVPVPSYFIDRHEVTNRQYKAFVDAGGYENPQYWREPFVDGGKTLTREQGMARLLDATGRPGPAGWEQKSYPAGQDDWPVTGLSWYEAMAYAAWAGKEVPTVYHWRRAAPNGVFSTILEFSNFTNKQIAPAGAFKGIGEFGTYDMAGNAREWCFNSAGNRRQIMGGAFNQPNYLYVNPDAVDAFDRAAINGFRTIKRLVADPVPAPLLQPVVSLTRDYTREKPVSDAEFEVFRRLYDYDRSDLKAVVESTDTSHADWRVERITYGAAYGGERIIAYLFLPKRGTAPYQTVVYFPHSGGEYLRSFELSEMNYLGFVLKSGRALLFPMYKGTYERRVTLPPDARNARRDVGIQRIKDLQRSVDYLLTRPDIDGERLAYFGVSLGARLGATSLAIEKRFKTAVLWSGGFRTTHVPAPEIDEINFAPRVTTPVLMLNGDQDFAFPTETSQKPMFQALGTPAADKTWKPYPGGHVFPFARIVKDTLDWLDKYLGVPK
jgi:formylglycine-generating enzyme required for sulfatase activity